MASPYAHRVTRVTLAGTYGGGAEEWNTGFFFGNANADADLPSQALADMIRDKWATAVPNLSMSSQYECTYVKLSSLGIDGRSSAADTIYSAMPANTKGTSAGWLAPQLSLVLSLQSATVRGVGAKGRMYLPGVSFGVGLDGHITTANALAVANTMGTFFHDINADAISPNVVVLASHGSLNKDGTPKIGGAGPVTHEVTSIKVGNVYDTQRRRRNQLAEVYSTSTTFP